MPATRNDSLFVETVRMPRRMLLPAIVVFLLLTAFLVLLWAVATMTAAQRVGTGVYLVAALGFLWGGPLWFIASHVVVDHQWLTRRVGHRRTRTAVSDISTVGIVHGREPGYAVVVLVLRDGTEREITTRRAEEMVAALGHPIPPPTP